MNAEQGVLTLAQWLSPSFPVGAFAYSHGLETVIASGELPCAEGLQGWLGDALAHGSGRNDCILLRVAYGAGSAGLGAVNDAALAICASAERAMETQLMGAAFCQTTAAIWGGEVDDLCYPVAVGAMAARMGIDVDVTAALFLQGFVSNLVSVAVRAVPLGQTEGQAVLAALTPLCGQIAAQTRGATLADLSSTGFLSDIAAMRHETLQPRIFRT